MAVKKKVAARAKKRRPAGGDNFSFPLPGALVQKEETVQEVRHPSDLEFAATRVDIERANVEFFTNELKRIRHNLERANLDLQHAQEHLAEMAMK